MDKIKEGMALGAGIVIGGLLGIGLVIVILESMAKVFQVI